ncbi:MAG: phosphotransferase family protein [Ilumatobacteraceae bacterium]
MPRWLRSHPMAEDLPGYDRAAVERWVGEHVEDRRRPSNGDVRGRSLQPDLRPHRHRGSRRRHPPAAARQAVSQGPRHVARVPDHRRPRPDRRAGARGLWVLRGRVGDRCEVLRDEPGHGRALYTLADVEEHVPVENRPRLAESFIDTLAALHSVDPESVGLADLGRPDGYVARQLKTWYGSWTASAEGAQYDDARIHELHEHFSTNLPEQGPGRIVHGDYGPHNVMTASEGRVTAVLDWEIATLGDSPTWPMR